MPKKLRGHVTLATPLFEKRFQGSCRHFPWEHPCQIWSSYLQPFWSLLVFNAPNFTGSRDPGHAPFYPLLTIGGWRPPSDIVWTMNRYHRVRDKFRQRQRSVSTLPLKMHYVGANFGGKLGKNRGYPYWILTPNERFFLIRFQLSVPNFIKIG